MTAICRTDPFQQLLRLPVDHRRTDNFTLPVSNSPLEHRTLGSFNRLLVVSIRVFPFFMQPSDQTAAVP